MKLDQCPAAEYLVGRIQLSHDAPTLRLTLRMQHGGGWIVQAEPGPEIATTWARVSFRYLQIGRAYHHSACFIPQKPEATHFRTPEAALAAFQTWLEQEESPSRWALRERPQFNPAEST